MPRKSVERQPVLCTICKEDISAVQESVTAVAKDVGIIKESMAEQRGEMRTFTKLVQGNGLPPLAERLTNIERDAATTKVEKEKAELQAIEDKKNRRETKSKKELAIIGGMFMGIAAIFQYVIPAVINYFK